ncbi:hypothetical protein CDAR_297801 [Caerostris darwini]|uniref:RING-type domain-containing protein n=1 Tax=Caerostris darwini TaxID=1538125 RepID=A0AAV4T995_9ARAC|nr:hypothetical protein CDAR_297801 [Caerostris darwini]
MFDAKSNDSKLLFQGYLIMVGVQKRKRQPMRSVKKLSSSSEIGKEAPLKRENAVKKQRFLESDEAGGRQAAIECKNTVKEAVTTSAPKCSICLDTTRRKKMKSLPCRHAFQLLCIDEFLKKNLGCPIREDIVQDDSSDWCPCVMYLRLIQSRNSQG